ncbi:MAG: energy transducer TonB [Bacteroidales bacterium]|nr:energy transducer TonB [Bacteroidales bacterium]
MARGKDTCKILKEIRRQIAAANDIEFITSECRYKGDCLGTCPKCEAEVRYLEEQLRARSVAGKRVMLVGMSAGVLFLAGCGGNSHPSDAMESLPEIELNADAQECEDSSEAESIEIDSQTEAVRAEEFVYDGIMPLVDIPVEEKVQDLNKVITMGEVPPIDLDLYYGEPVQYSLVDVKPEFPGGPEAMYRWIEENTHYPPECEVIGRVVVEFIVEVDGTLSNVKVVRSREPSCDKEAVRVIQSMPRWSPGYHNGNPVRVVCQLPIAFYLK